jgi:signal transduction histidine kinase
MPEDKINIIIAGAGEKAKALIGLLHSHNAIRILGVVDKDSGASGIKYAQGLGIPTASGYQRLLTQNGPVEIIDFTESKDAREELGRLSNDNIKVIDSRTSIVEILLQDLNTKASEIEKIRAELEIQSWGLKKTDEGIRTLYKELEKKNEELKQLDQMKSDFLSFVSHELRTPLTTIKETVSQTLEGLLGPTTPKQQEFLCMCLENIDRLARIINNLLDLSKIEAGKTELKRKLTDIVGLAKRTCLTFSSRLNSKGLEMRIAFSPETIEVYLDEDKIIQVFNNLIGNSIKFTQQGFIEVSVIDKGDFLECSVSDTGKGISDEDVQHLFTKFRQFGQAVNPAEKGTGLGLAITKGIVELHHGKIWAESKLGEGTRFIFTLPKYTSRQILKERITDSLKAGLRTQELISVLVLELSGLPALQEKLGRQKAESFLNELAKILEEGLPNRERIIVEADAMFGILKETTRAQALNVKDRLLLSGTEFLKKNGLDKETTIAWRVLNFPEDGSTVEQLCTDL